jgi:hypothetical protein
MMLGYALSTSFKEGEGAQQDVAGGFTTHGATTDAIGIRQKGIEAIPMPTRVDTTVGNPPYKIVSP